MFGNSKDLEHSSLPTQELSTQLPRSHYVHWWRLLILLSALRRKHKLRCGKDANCTATMVLYCLTYSGCKMQYVGQTVNLRKRLNKNNHKFCIGNFDPRQHTLGFSATYTWFCTPAFTILAPPQEWWTPTYRTETSRAHKSEGSLFDYLH